MIRTWFRLPQHAASQAATNTPAWLTRGRVPCLDGLRGISILLVILAHVARTHGFPAPGPIRAAAHYGTIGVDVFFAISGFLITLLLLRELDRTGTLSMRGFYLRRALRILPAYVAFLLVVFVLNCLGLSHLRGSDWQGVLTYTVNFLRKPSWEIGHVWSLSIEEQFYLVWPPLLLLLGVRRARLAALGYLVMAPAFRLLVWAFARPSLAMVDAWTLTRMDSIAVGCVLALLASDPAFRQRMQLTGEKALGFGLLAVGLLLASLVARECTLYDIALGYSVNAGCIATIIWICVNNGEGRLGRILQSRPLVTLGVLSYSLYLWQQLFLNPHNTSWPCRWPVNLCFAALAAIASYLFIEGPFLRLKDRSSGARRRPEVLPGAAECGLEPSFTLPETEPVTTLTR